MTTDEEAIKASKAIFRTAQMGGINITSAYLTDPKSTSAEVTDISLDQTTLSLKAGETATLKGIVRRTERYPRIPSDDNNR